MSSRLSLAALALLTASPAAIKEFPLPRANAFPHDVAVAPDGSVYYSDQSNSFIGQLDPVTGAVTDIATPTPGSGPHGIIVAPDGMIWYTGNAHSNIGRLDPPPALSRNSRSPAPREIRTRPFGTRITSGSRRSSRIPTASSIRQRAR